MPGAAWSASSTGTPHHLVPAWDLAYLAYRLVPLSAPDNPDSIDSPVAQRRRRLALLCRTYAHGATPASILSAAVPRLHELAEFTELRAGEDASELAAHVALYRDAATWLTRHLDELAATE